VFEDRTRMHRFEEFGKLNRSLQRLLWGIFFILDSRGLGRVWDGTELGFGAGKLLITLVPRAAGRRSSSLMWGNINGRDQVAGIV